MIENPTVERIQSFACAQRLYRLGVIVHIVVDVLVIGAALARSRQRRVRRAETAFGTRRTAAWRIERKMESINKDHAGGRGTQKKEKIWKKMKINQELGCACWKRGGDPRLLFVCAAERGSRRFYLHQFLYQKVFVRFQMNEKCLISMIQHYHQLNHPQPTQPCNFSKMKEISLKLVKSSKLVSLLVSKEIKVLFR